MSWRPPISTLTYTLFPYTTLFRSQGGADSERGAAMNAVNPKFVLRNHLAQKAIVDAEHGDREEIERLLTILRRPFDEHPQFEHYAAEPPPEARHIEEIGRASCRERVCQYV